MRATIKNYIDAAKRRREEEGEGGFSLIELIIVVVILGILVAVAIPIFASIQDTAENNALKAAAANGASAAATAIAEGNGSAVLADVEAAAESGGDGDGITTELTSTDVTDVSTVCVKATGYDKEVSAGPAEGCATAVTAVTP